MNSNQHKLSILFIIIAASMWGMIGLFVRTVNQYSLTAMDIVFIRCGGAFLILFPVMLIFKRNELKIHLKDIWCFIGSGIISITFFNFCYFTTIAETSLSVAAILLYTSPAFVILLSTIIFKEKLTHQKVIALLIAFLGCLCVSGITTGGIKMTPMSLLTGIGAGIGYALYSIFGRLALNRGYSSTTISVYSFLFCALGTIPFIDTYKIISTITYYPQTWYSVAGLIIMTTLLAYLFYTAGLNHLENGKAAIIACVEPMVATLIGVLIFHEALTLSNILGIIFIIGATVIVNYPNKKINNYN